MMQYLIDRNQRKWAVESLNRYWSKGQKLIEKLAIPSVDLFTEDAKAPKLIEIAIPEWAEDLAPDGYLLIPKAAVLDGNDPEWMRTDWIAAIIWYLDGVAERFFEQKHGPIHSYSFRLKRWNPCMWERAWVNRIALFLRRWAARINDASEDDLFGPLPSTKIVLTHDVDAIRKTFAIRCKQAVFHAYNAGKSIITGRPLRGLKKFGKALSFFTSNDDYWCFDEILKLEEQYGVKSIFNFYSGCTGIMRHPRALLLDPGYSVREERVQKMAKQLMEGGWIVGVHHSCMNYNNSALLKSEKNAIEDILNTDLEFARIHWLRFSWEHTWLSLNEAGIACDMTLGFNNRPGFRNGAALSVHPWSKSVNGELDIRIMPTVLMDSHLYDYCNLDDQACIVEIEKWIEEIKAVCGEASIIWHQHTLSDDYGWSVGFKQLLKLGHNFFH
ncbi:MAG: hypothetical protein JXB42_10100 [Deltaproteobacteria bacterium]|nr:hypothetical protein [Deltaproteobacteria bacterium]